MHVHDGP